MLSSTASLQLLAQNSLQPIKRTLNETFFKSKFLSQTFNFEGLRQMARD